MRAVIGIGGALACCGGSCIDPAGTNKLPVRQGTVGGDRGGNKALPGLQGLRGDQTTRVGGDPMPPGLDTPAIRPGEIKPGELPIVAGVAKGDWCGTGDGVDIGGEGM